VAAMSTPSRPSQAQSFLRITELMYHPPTTPGDTFAPQEYEFIELTNIGPSELDLTGVRLTEGVTFDFTLSNVTTLQPGEYVLVVKNTAAFAERYGPDLNVAGEYTDYLANGGEPLRLDDAQNETVLAFTYDDTWHPTTDGHGFSLAIIDENASYTTWDEPTAWQPSAAQGGSPGTSD